MTRACAEKVSAVVYISNILGHGTIWINLSEHVLCLNTFKWKMRAAKNCHAKNFYHGKALIPV